MLKGAADRSDVRSRRLTAAVASDGTSGNDIYALFERLVVEFGLVGGKLLDFGAGKGALTRRLYRTGRFTRITTVDIMPSRPTDLLEPIDWVSADLNDALPFSDGGFDVIIAAEVIEHLENPRFVAREWYRLLRPGGWLLLSTPNNESLRSILALVFRGHYAHFGQKSYPAHITALLRKDLERILAEAGFDWPSFHYTNYGMIPKTRFSWQKMSIGLLSSLRFSDNFMAVTRKQC
jgi:2-polyprenyl-3-methyl-5-hydroxy-6-metoxy-1,4-benzoquinol methylase